MKHILKKGVALLLTLTMVVSMSLISVSVQAVENNTVYFKPASNWYKDGARFAIYFFNDKGSAPGWASMTLVEDGVYSAQLPSDTYTDIIFCRMNPANTANNWTNKWNQTADLVIPTDGKNCYTLSEGSWDHGTGSWSVYNYIPVVIQPSTYRVLVGDTNSSEVIDVRDVTEIQRNVAFKTALTDEAVVANDVNGDKAVNVNDATFLMRYLSDCDGDYGKTGFYYGETPVKGNLLKNGKFEVNGKDIPFGWERRDSKNADIKVVDSNRQANSICVKMNNTKENKNTIAAKIYGLEAGAMYKLNGYIKTEKVTGGSEDNGAYFAVYQSYTVESSRTNWRKGTTAWGEESVYFVANSAGYAEIACCMDNAGVGYFEGLTVTKYNDYATDSKITKVCVKGKYIDTYINKDIAAKFTAEELQEWADDLDFAYEYLADLVGGKPYNGDKFIINSTSEPFVRRIIAHAGNPIKLNDQYEFEDLARVSREGCVSFGMFHEIGHNFDYLFDWSIDLEVTTNYKMLYILDNCDKMVYAGDTPTDSRGLREYYKKTHYDTSVGARNGKYDLFAMVYIYSRFTDVVGWDTIKATLREFGENMPKINTNLGKFTYFMYRVQENYNKLNPNASGTEVRDSFPKGELEYVKELIKTNRDGGYYNPSHDYFK
ncbi:MAG: dockerin type I domain-containing protein [Ruminococcus sp.]|nr:dockerin type I domain-containing protein [Ruminococcus sp.]